MIPGGPRLLSEPAPRAQLDAAYLAAYPEMHFAAFVRARDSVGPEIVSASSGPALHVSELHKAGALTECFYTDICGVLDETVEFAPGSVALDVACATGRMSAELAARGARVLGIDLSEQFVNEARRIVLGSGGRPKLAFARFKGGYDCMTAELPWELEPQDVMFAVADAVRIPLDSAVAHVVLVLNLIDRVRDPGAVLREAWRCVAPGGYLLHAAPFDYRDSSTPDKAKRIYDLDDVFEQAGGEVVLKRSVAFPIRRAWSQAVMAYVDQVALYRKPLA